MDPWSSFEINLPQVVKGGVCDAHGAKVNGKLCKHPGFEKHATQGGVCVAHGAI